MEKTSAIFDKLAKTYEENVDFDNPYNNDYERPAMISNIPSNIAGKSVLDAGCAAGWYSEYLSHQGAIVTGVDISKKMIEAANRRIGDKAKFVCHDLQEDLPFGENEFDLIISSLSLHYLKDWDRTFSEFNRILKHEGTFLFSVHHPFMDFHNFDSEDYFQKELLTDTWKKSDLTVDVHFYRRPLQEIVMETIRFFQLGKIIEPQPRDQMKHKYLKGYQYLMKNPHFLIVKAKSKK
ncbi:SAM-dependent methyltransferase [Oceanobacillus arenosus]|uniref:SAM-dependent methyltransferase n=1 Tax=Oceanobacillus arenosus TaxID=1229153 RepID=A0A3D8PPV6_9BACI|nr:class I SAM-dependent methyltransferase [Oceanobacillus arenosus]RDW18123.1 SAM-dependent methyltransferase [Oceanobacillus arenosus]